MLQSSHSDFDNIWVLVSQDFSYQGSSHIYTGAVWKRLSDLDFKIAPDGIIVSFSDRSNSAIDYFSIADKTTEPPSLVSIPALNARDPFGLLVALDVRNLALRLT